MTYTITRDEDFLQHHGILGMKWGIRRYQNEDGSLTPAGQKRYDKLQSQMNELNPNSANSKSQSSPSSTQAEEPQRKKSVSEMSDQELQAALNRLRNEQAYAQLTAPVMKPVKESGAQAVAKVLKDAGGAALKDLATKAVQYGTKQAVKAAVGDDIYNALYGNQNGDQKKEAKKTNFPDNWSSMTPDEKSKWLSTKSDDEINALAKRATNSKNMVNNY